MKEPKDKLNTMVEIYITDHHITEKVEGLKAFLELHFG